MTDNINTYLTPRVVEFDLTWPTSVKATDCIKEWATTLYTNDKYEDFKDGIPYFTTPDLSTSTASSDFIVTRWGKGPVNKSFFILRGDMLFELIPWWRQMQRIFEELDLQSWYSTPAILVSEANIRRHTDIDRNTVFNYNIFGAEATHTHLWYNPTSTTDNTEKYDESYSYSPGKTILMDSSVQHGGFAADGIAALERRAIWNMGFHNKFDQVLDTIRNNNVIEQLRDIK